jgi:hypothetical protein
MSKREHRKVRQDNERNAHRHSDEWWEECARVDVDALRREVRADVFSVRRVKRLCYFGRRLEGWERQTIRELVARKQKEIYLRERRIKDL